MILVKKPTVNRKSCKGNDDNSDELKKMNEAG